MRDLFGRLDAVVFLKVKDNWYYVKHMTSSGHAAVREGFDEQGEPSKVEVRAKGESVEVDCVDEHLERHKFKFESRGLTDAFAKTIEAEQETGSKQLLRLNCDTGEWWTDDLKEMAKVFPAWKNFLKEIPKKYTG